LRLPRDWAAGFEQFACAAQFITDSLKEHPPSSRLRFAQAKEIAARLPVRYSLNVMSITEIRELPLHEKLQIMEVLWEDLRSHAEGAPVPQWHKELRDARRKAVEAGREKILEWDEVRNSLGTRQA